MCEIIRTRPLNIEHFVLQGIIGTNNDIVTW